MKKMNKKSQIGFLEFFRNTIYIQDKIFHTVMVMNSFYEEDENQGLSCGLQYKALQGCLQGQS